MEERFVISNITAGRLNALVKHIMRQTGETDPKKAVRLVNSGKWILSQSKNHWWREEDGIVYFNVTSFDWNVETWITHFQTGDCYVGDRAQRVLRTSNFPGTKGITATIAILPGSLFNDEHRTTAEARLNAVSQHNFQDPTAELACLICERLRNQDAKAMGFSRIVVMHEPIDDPQDGGSLLTAQFDPLLVGRKLLTAFDSSPSVIWGQDTGFAFVSPVKK